MTDALPVLTLSQFGGPLEISDANRPELPKRVKAIRHRLKQLVLRLQQVSDAELETWLREHGKKQPKVWDEEGRRLMEGAWLLFQLGPDPLKNRESLRPELDRIWHRESKHSRWFERNRQQFICERVADWLVRDEDQYLASQVDQRERPVPLENLDDAPPLKATKEAAGNPTEGQRSIGPLKRSTVLVGSIAVLVLAVAAAALALKDSDRIFGESIRTSHSPAAALECADGDTEDFSFQPATFPDDPEQVDHATLSVSVGRFRFWLESLEHRERPVGKDSWDFLFKPRDAARGLSFIFRQVPGTDAGYGYVIDGPPGNGQAPTNVVCNLIDFHKGAMGEFLEDRSNDEGLNWAGGA